MLQNFEELARVQPPGLWGGVLLSVGGDLDHLCNTIGLPHYNGNEMCSLCLANDSTIPWNNFHETAAWRDTLVTNDQFLARLRRPLHPLAAHPIFNLHSYRHDLLHMIDVHGVASAIIANILWVHISPERLCNVLPGGTVDERLEFLHGDVLAYYQTTKAQNHMPKLKRDNIKTGSDPPDLRGNGIKAAVTRRFIPYVVELQARACNLAPSAKHTHMHRAIESLHLLISLLYSTGTFLTDEEKIEVNRLLRRR